MKSTLTRILGVILLAGLTAYLVDRFIPSEQEKDTAPPEDFHQWVHDNLHLDEAQHATLAPIESAYESDRQRLATAIRTTGHKLADLLRSETATRESIDAELARLNDAQSELRRVTLHHFLAMKEHLDPEQAAQLLDWTHDRIATE